MNIYILLIIIFIIILIGGIIAYVFLMNDEKRVKEVDNEYLKKLGKLYTKEEFEERLFDRYIDIILSVQNNNYELLRDAVSDEEYNKLLNTIKSNKEKNIKPLISNVRKGMCKLISFKVSSEYEIAKIWIQYTCNEYTLAPREIVDEKGNKIIEEQVVSGDKTKDIYYSYVVTFIKGRVKNEDITCPNCAYHTNILLNSKCPSCDSILAPKRSHWVYIEKNTANMLK